jgi:hypothetical protein
MITVYEHLYGNVYISHLARPGAGVLCDRIRQCAGGAVEGVHPPLPRNMRWESYDGQPVDCDDCQEVYEITAVAA